MGEWILSRWDRPDSSQARSAFAPKGLGGAFALGFTLRAPERVERLMLVDSAGLGDEIPGGLLSYFRVRVPLLDELSWAERAHRLIKNSKIEIIPECGHLPPIENRHSSIKLSEAFCSAQNDRNQSAIRIHHLSAPGGNASSVLKANSSARYCSASVKSNWSIR
jgi:hypothetical protein